MAAAVARAHVLPDLPPHVPPGKQDARQEGCRTAPPFPGEVCRVELGRAVAEVFAPDPFALPI